jgi:hypothetical protein
LRSAAQKDRFALNHTRFMDFARDAEYTGETKYLSKYKSRVFLFIWGSSLRALRALREIDIV